MNSSCLIVAVKNREPVAGLLRGVHMARMYSSNKGKSGSSKPFVATAPEWSNNDASAVTSLIVELGKSGKSSAEIGTILRDQHAIPDVRLVLKGKRIAVILAENDIGGAYPEDMMNLMRKAVTLINHLSSNRKDLHNNRALHLTEAKIRRLARYYQSEGRLAADWKYKRDQLRLMVE